MFATKISSIDILITYFSFLCFSKMSIQNNFILLGYTVSLAKAIYWSLLQGSLTLPAFDSHFFQLLVPLATG